MVETAGGGGFWNPLERAPEKVLADVRSGYVSVEAARRDYGVAIKQSGRRFELDSAATAELRGIEKSVGRFGLSPAKAPRRKGWAGRSDIRRCGESAGQNSSK